MKNKNKEEVVKARVTKEVYEKLEEKTEELNEQSFGETTMSDTIRLALTNFLSNHS